MHVFERGMHHSSVRIAKERLKSLLVSDRVQCQPDTYELFKNYCDFRIVEETDIIREILRGYRKHLALMGISIPDEITPHNVFLL